MDNKAETHTTWETVLNNFFITKIHGEEEKYIKEIIKNIESDCKKKNYFNIPLIQHYFEDGKLKREKQEDSIIFQRRRINALFALKDTLQNTMLDGAIVELERNLYEQKVKDIAEKYKPNEWLAKASKSAASVSFATHVIKLTHSKIDSPSIYDQINVVKASYLTTSTLSIKTIDGAVAGNQFAPIFQLLELECNGTKLATELSNPHSYALEPFAQGNEHLEWNNGFSKALTTGESASHLLAKQVYFPTKNSACTLYHLLCNVPSSSIAQTIFEKLFSDETRQAQKVFQNGKFSASHSSYYPQKGKIGVTASNHSNASQLNASRGGKLYLFASAPPTWQTQSKPPIYQKSFFNSQLRHFVSKNDIDYLRDFLIRLDKIDLSIKHPERQKWINAWVNNIVDDVLAYANNIQNMDAGWSATERILLKHEHQLFLDPYRHDETFQAFRKSNDWQTVVCEDFARWLNRSLSGKDKRFSPHEQHRRMWITIMESSLRKYDELIKIDMTHLRVLA